MTRRHTRPVTADDKDEPVTVRTSDPERAPSPVVRTSLAILVGIAPAIVFGLAFDDAAIGIALGLILGAAGGVGVVDVAGAVRRRPEESDDVPTRGATRTDG